MGRDPVLTKDEEGKIVKWLIHLSRCGFPQRKCDLLDTDIEKIVTDDNRPTPFTHNRPGEKWYHCFLKRHPELSLHVMSDPDRILNGDESGFNLCPKTGKVIGSKGARNILEIKKGNDRENITTLFVFTASGKTALPCVVLKYVRIPKAILDSSDPSWHVTKSLWMDEKPSDVGVFKLLKSEWKKIIHQLLRKPENINSAVLPIAKDVLEKPSLPQTTINRFKKCGLFPFNPDAPDYTKCVQNHLEKVNEPLENPITAEEIEIAQKVLTNLENRLKDENFENIKELVNKHERFKAHPVDMGIVNNERPTKSKYNTPAGSKEIENNTTNTFAEAEKTEAIDISREQGNSPVESKSNLKNSTYQLDKRTENSSETNETGDLTITYENKT
ncbi:hypothetical protein NQ314_016805, partial [Rhamnusium bicolor]